MSDTGEVDEVVEVVVWRRYLVAVKQVHRRAWFWLLLGFVLMAVLAAAVWCHQPRCQSEVPFPVAVHHPHRPPPPVVVVVVPPHAPPVTPAPVHVVHRVVHHVVHQHHCPGM